MFFAVIAKDRAGCTALRAQTKLRHSAHLDAAAEGLRVLQTGPLLDESDAEVGSLLILAADTKETVEAFVNDDPYAKAGLFAHVEIHPWLWRRGNPYVTTPIKPGTSVTNQETNP